MKVILGVFLFITSTIALLFLIYRDINFLWYLLLVVIGITGVVLVLSSGKKRIATIEKQIDENLERLKVNGERIMLDFDSCEFIDHSYSHGVVDQRFTVGGISDEITRTENVGQSILTYHYFGAGQPEKFTQAFPASGEALKFYVLNGNITLYVDPFNRARYFFDLKT